MSLEKEFIVMLETKEVSADEVYRLYNEALKNFKKSKEYKKIRQELIKNKCEDCGENKGLRLVNRILPFKKLEQSIILDEIKKQIIVTDEEIENEIDFIGACPNCENSEKFKSYFRDKKEKYKCHNCGLTFENLKKIKSNYTEQQRIIAYYVFKPSMIARKLKTEYNVRKNSEETKEKVEKILKVNLIEWLKENELNKENCITLCKSCHYNMMLLESYRIPPKILMLK